MLSPSRKPKAQSKDAGRSGQPRRGGGTHRTGRCVSRRWTARASPWPGTPASRCCPRSQRCHPKCGISWGKLEGNKERGVRGRWGTARCRQPRGAQVAVSGKCTCSCCNINTQKPRRGVTTAISIPFAEAKCYKQESSNFLYFAQSSYCYRVPSKVLLMDALLQEKADLACDSWKRRWN